MNLLHEQVRHRLFGVGSIIEQAETVIKVKFSDEYGTRMFQYPLAFDKYLILCNAGLQDPIREEAHLKAKQVEVERKRREEKYRHEQEERIKSLRQTAPKKRASAKKSTKKASAR